jgi:hypothetical protein
MLAPRGWQLLAVRLGHRRPPPAGGLEEADVREEPVNPLLRQRVGPRTSTSPSIMDTSRVWPRPRSWAQLTAFFTSALILASSAAVSFVSAKEVGHMLPSSRFAEALNPNVAYLSLNFDAAVK